MPVGIASALVGIIIGVVTLTGVATTFAGYVIALGKSNLFLSLVLTIFTCLLLGTSGTTIAFSLVALPVRSPSRNWLPMTTRSQPRTPATPGDDVDDDDESVEVTPAEEENIAEQAELRLPVVYEIVRRRGKHELRRPVASLWWSGLAGGLSIGLSILCQGLLADYLPDAAWSPMVAKLGYSVGFVVVITAGQQLFTESTLTAVAPLLAGPSLHNFWLLSRLWTVVVLANFVGAALFALFIGHPSVLSPEVSSEITSISLHALEPAPFALMLRAIVAGFLIASLVWILAKADGDQVLLIVLITWLIALGDFTHVVAGSVEAAWLVFAGERTVLDVVFGFILPALTGNVVGGTLLFGVLAYAQIADEMKTER